MKFRLSGSYWHALVTRGLNEPKLRKGASPPVYWINVIDDLFFKSALLSLHIYTIYILCMYDIENYFVLLSGLIFLSKWFRSKVPLVIHKFYLKECKEHFTPKILNKDLTFNDWKSSF